VVVRTVPSSYGRGRIRREYRWTTRLNIEAVRIKRQEGFSHCYQYTHMNGHDHLRIPLSFVNFSVIEISLVSMRSFNSLCLGNYSLDISCDFYFSFIIALFFTLHRTPDTDGQATTSVYLLARSIDLTPLCYYAGVRRVSLPL
jgi:hypothetical protein